MQKKFIYSILTESRKNVLRGMHFNKKLNEEKLVVILNGSILDGRDITSVIMKDASIKFFITANVRVRALRRFKELKSLNKKITYQEVLKSIKKRDKSDYQRAYSPLKKTKDSILINTSNLTKRSCFLKIKQIIDKKIKLNGNL